MIVKRNYRHFFHLVDQSPWPLYVAISTFLLTLGFVIWVHYGYITFMLLGLCATLYGMFVWCWDVIRESTYQGYHTKVVRRSLKIGMVLFIISEVFFFYHFFGLFFIRV